LDENSNKENSSNSKKEEYSTYDYLPFEAKAVNVISRAKILKKKISL
jgi:hypothetical protein